MSFTGNLILWGSIIWLPALLYFLLVNETKPKKNIVVGITLPYSGQNDPQVLAVLARFKREMRLTCLLLTAAAVPGMMVRGFGLSMTVWLVWVDLICILPCVPYVRCNRALREVKEQRGWAAQGQTRPVADLKAAAEELRWIRPVWFAVPFLISLVPVVLDRELWLLWGTMSLMIALFYVIYRYCFRARSEMVDGCTERTVALTRVRRYNWGKAWLVMAWATGIFNLLLWAAMDIVWLQMGVILAYTLVVMVTVLGIELRLRRLQETLCRGSGQDFYVDEDDKWIWGMFYYDPNDSRLVVNARVGMNTGVNLAKPAGKLLMGLVALLLAAMPLIGVGLMNMEKAPVELEVAGEAIVCSHYTKTYTLPLEEIAEVGLVEELPPMTRMAGTGLPSACIGKWNSALWGRFTCCIDPRQGPWLLVETVDGGIWLFGGGEAAAEEIFTLLQ